MLESSGSSRKLLGFLATSMDRESILRSGVEEGGACSPEASSSSSSTSSPQKRLGSDAGAGAEVEAGAGAGAELSVSAIRNCGKEGENQ